MLIAVLYWAPFLFWTAALLGHSAVWVELVNRLHGVGWKRSLIDGLTLACGVAFVGVPLAGAVVFLLLPEGETLPTWLRAYAWLAVVGFLLAIAHRLWLARDPQRDRQSRRVSVATVDLDHRLAGEACPPAIRRLARLPGNSLLRLAVEHHEIVIDRLPAELEGMRIAHLTDLHMSGRLSQPYFEEVVATANDWSPDFALITGDIVEHTPQLEWVEPTLGRLQARHAACFVLGNHDEMVDCPELRRRLVAAGLRDVGRSAESFEIRGQQVTVSGDERPWFPAPEPFQGPDALRIALVHTPDRFEWAEENGVDLVLAGHNHGGQVCFPLLGALLCPSRYGVRYASGTFRVGGTVMHVSRGTGSLFPIRWNCPPELGLFTLVRG